MDPAPVEPAPLLAAADFAVGPLRIGPPLLVTWLVMGMLVLLAWFGTRRLDPLRPGLLATALEGVVEAMRAAIAAAAPEHADRLLPFVGTLWLFLVSANLIGLVPGLATPTADLSTTAALAVLVFLSTHWYGIRIDGLRAHLRHYLSPSPILLPFHIVGEITRTLALAVRLFGNMMSLDLAALMLLLVAGLLVPLPLLLLHVVEALVQAYIFGMLALVYIAGSLQGRAHDAAAPDSGRSS